MVDAYTLAKTLSRTPAPAPCVRDGGGAGHAPGPEAGPASPRVRTVLPSRRETACCHCGWESHVFGRTHLLVCNKCHQRFDIVDFTLGTSCAPVIRTGGVVRIAPGGNLTGGDVRAAFVVVEGRVSGGRLEAFRRLEFRRGSRLDAEDGVRFRDLLVDDGAELDWKGPLEGREVVVAGRLRAEIRAADRVRVLSGASFRGALRTASLRVEEGGGLAGRMRIGCREPEA